MFELNRFSEQIFGKVTGTFAMSRLPSIPGRVARIRTYAANTSPIWIGTWVNTGSFPLPYQLAAGTESEWFPLVMDDAIDSEGNLNSLWQNGSSGSCYFAYWVLR